MRLPVTLSMAMLLILPSISVAAPVFWFTEPYQGLSDSPFNTSGLGDTFHLEDFEDGQLDAPGVILNSGFGAFAVLGPGKALSVENGPLGHSLESRVGWQDTATKTTTIYHTELTIEFDPSVFTTLPTDVGLAITHFAAGHPELFLRVYGPFGELAGTFSAATTSVNDGGLMRWERSRLAPASRRGDKRRKQPHGPTSRTDLPFSQAAPSQPGEN